MLKYFFVIVPYLATYIFPNFLNEPELGAEMAFIPFSSSILDAMKFEPTTFRLWLTPG